jgi:hypothetical protein
MPSWKPVRVTSPIPPSGLSADLYRYGGTAAANTALVTRSVPYQPVPGDLAAAHRESDEGQAGQVEVFDEFVQINSEIVVIVPVPELGRDAKSAPTVGDQPISVLDQCGNLIFPGSARQRLAVDGNRHDRSVDHHLSRALAPGRASRMRAG